MRVFSENPPSVEKSQSGSLLGSESLEKVNAGHAYPLAWGVSIQGDSLLALLLGKLLSRPTAFLRRVLLKDYLEREQNFTRALTQSLNAISTRLDERQQRVDDAWKSALI